MTKRKVLIVDDEIELSELVSFRLEANGYEVQLASNGIEGVIKTKEFKPDLILLDVLMPHMNGYEFTKELKDHENTKDIPVILFTAGSDSKIGRECLKYTNDLVIKPYDDRELLSKIENLI